MMGPLVEKLAAEGDCLATYLIDELDKAHVAMQSENVAVAAYMAGSERRQRTPVGICVLVEVGV